MENKVSFITGITGQDGSILAEFLLEKGYEVHGLIRRSSSFNTARIEHVYNNKNLHLHYGDMTDGNRLTNLVLEIKPDEAYNLAAQSHVRVSFDQPLYTSDVVGQGTLRLLEAVRQVKTCKFYQASSSEMFGNAPAPQSELTPFDPSSPYACAKVFAHYQTINYRKAYGLFACCGILFNHESHVRGGTFLTRKVTRAATRISLGLQNELRLGNLDAKRDWGYAKDYVEAMWLMLQQDVPDDYVIATGETHTVREFLERVFDKLKLDWTEYVVIDPKYFRPSEVNCLLGDASKAKKQLNWVPKTSFQELIDIMVDHDLELAKKEQRGN